MGTAQLSVEEHALLENISWGTYERLLKEAGQRHIRFTYDDGKLEIMTLGFGHENYSSLISYLIMALMLELNIPIRSGGSTTLKRKRMKKGLEPDKCYWIKNESRMRGKTEFDPRKDPPPDLAVEIDISRSSLDRMAIYAALGVPEVWRFDEESFLVYQLQADGRYEARSQSLSFPFLPIAEVERFLRQSQSRDETSLLRDFCSWVRLNLLPASNASSAKPKKPGKGNGRNKGTGP
jgi:Uma2 family endonuclease